jgi:hypothetical protein
MKGKDSVKKPSSVIRPKPPIDGLELDESGFLPPQRPWSKHLPTGGGIINIRRDDDYVTSLLRECISSDTLPPDRRNYIWHFVWENCPYLPHWSLPIIFDGDTKIKVTDWHSPTEFINWFGWHCACAFIWCNHQTSQLQPDDKVIGLLTSNKPAKMPGLFHGKQKVIDRNKKHLEHICLNYLQGPRTWKQITIEEPVYPTWGLLRMLSDIDRTIDRKTLDWIDLATTKLERGAMGRILHIQETMIPQRVLHPAKVFNRMGGGLDSSDHWG